MPRPIAHPTRPRPESGEPAAQAKRAKFSVARPKATVSVGFAACGAIALALSGPAQAQIYKWTDAEGRIHYGNQAPPAAAPSAQALDIPSQPSSGQAVDNVGAFQRATRELRQLRAVNRDVPVSELDRPASGRKRSKEPPYIGYEDRVKIDNLNGDIRRLSSSTFGTPASRAREIRAIKDELRQIYRKYGLPYH
ncbi:MAG: DUF4124 domain-containing protein [Candidatus Competibacter sp.]|nr:DUF4124 domain-containing protein [Candidatus Competibacter sp.]